MGLRPSPPLSQPLRYGSILEFLGAGPFLARSSERRRFGLCDLALAAAWLRRLEGAPRVELAIGQTRNLILPAEVEIGQLRVADRPAAAAVGEGLDRLALVEGDDELLDGRGERLGLRMIESSEGGVANGEARFCHPLGARGARPRP